MTKMLQRSESYDEMFTQGGYQGVFDLPYRRSPYYPMFKVVARTLKRHGVQKVLEVGCGTGGMAHLLADTLQPEYIGFDFSPVAVAKAQKRLDNDAKFFVGDATRSHTYLNLKYDSIVCTEVLEHIEDDLLAISHWAAGTFCVCSVPNFDASSHVRFFRDANEVMRRYSGLIDIEKVELKAKPFLNDLTFRNWLDAVRWNRYRPTNLKWLMGFSNFNVNGGWYVFSGNRRG